MNTNPREKSVVYDLFAHPTRNVIVGLGILGVAAIGVASANHDRDPKEGAIAVCTGEQDVLVGSGETLEGLIEAFVKTPARDRLKSDGGLTTLAKAITFADNGEPIFVFSNDTYKEMATKQLYAGEVETIPKECHVVK